MGHVPFRAAAVLGLLVGALALAGVAAAATNPSPYEGGTSLLPVPVALPALPTAPFPLLTDLSDVGVNAADLAADGPSMKMAASNYGHSTGDDESHSGGGSHPHLLVVDDDRTECPDAQFVRIQDAVNAASPGDFIKVCRGTYPEYVTVPAGKDGLTVYGTGFLDVYIKAPSAGLSTGSRDIVHVAGAKRFTLLNVVVTGPFEDLAGCVTSFTGVRVDGGGSATLAGDHITQIWAGDPALRGCQTGLAVLAGSSTGGPGTLTVAYSLVDHYQKNGITIDELGSYGNVDHTIVLGEGSIPYTAQNGIQVGFGATASLTYDKVSENVYALAPASNGTGVLLYQAGKVNVSSSDVYHNDDGISLYDTDNSTIANNYSHNQVVYDGLFADTDSMNNTFSKNVARYNAGFDCDDMSTGTKTAGTANYWIKDVGDTENRPGLCHAH